MDRSLLDSGTELLGRLDAIKLSKFERMKAEVAVPELLTGPVQATFSILGEAGELLSSLPGLVKHESDGDQNDTEQDSSSDEDGDFDFDFDFDLVAESTTPAVEGDATFQDKHATDDVDAAFDNLEEANGQEKFSPEVVEGMCAMLVKRLNRSKQRLHEALKSRSKWQLITEGEEGVRVAKRALHTGLNAVARSIAPEAAGDFPPHDQLELQSALAVRELLLNFQSSILDFTQDVETLDENAIKECLRSAGACIKSFFDNPLYSEVRSEDRYQVLQFQNRILKAYMQRAFGRSSQELLQDFRAFAELLSQINQREVLVQHERKVQQRCSLALSRAQSLLSVDSKVAWEQFKDTLVELENLRFRGSEIQPFLEELDLSSHRPPAEFQALLDRAAAMLAAIHI